MTGGSFARYTDLPLTGGPLRVHDDGPRDGPAVVLLHGAMLDTAAFAWRHLMPALAARCRVVAPDLPRHGGSRPWRGVLDQAAMEAVLQELLDRLGIERAVLVGLSMGGAVATGYALAHPGRVAGLVAINPGGVDPVRPMQFLTWAGLQSEHVLRAGTVLAARPAVLRSSIAASLVRGTRTRDFDELVRLAEAEARRRVEHRERALDDWQISAYGPWRMRLDLTPRLHRLAVPSLWVHGRRDALVRRTAVLRAASRAPRARFAEIEGAGHFAPLDEPERVHDLVAAFLATTRGPGEPHPGPGRTWMRPS